jgi:hypothetical protein
LPIYEAAGCVGTLPQPEGLASGALAMAAEPEFSRVFAQASRRDADDESAEKGEQQVDFRIHFLHLAGRCVRLLLSLQEASAR